jgi:arylsulfatase A-like enzyme
MIHRTAILFLLPLLFPTFTRAQDRKPNIVFILADDLGQRDLGCYGSTFYETPNIDALARSGTRFTNAYAACNVCSPTRASILTGKYPARLHLTDWLPGRKDFPNQKLKKPDILDHLPPTETNLGIAFKQAGYATAFVGKWHLGAREFWPDKQGFDLNAGGCGIGHPPSYFSPYKIPALADGPKGEYLTDRLTTEACKFIESNKDVPFFLYFSHYAVHNPQQAKPEHIQRFKDKAAKLPHADTPEFIDDLGRKVRQLQNNPTYAANIFSMDESVGRVVKTLADLSLDKNTIIVFTSDNGGLSTAEGTPTSNAPLRMGKGWNYEGGIREPLLVLWPGVTQPNSTSDQPVISTDYYPTFLDIASLPPRPEQHLDGISITPALKGQPLNDRPLFWHYPHYSNQGGPPGGAVRLGDFKLIEPYETMTPELYNLKTDPDERHDLAKELPDKTKELVTLLHNWRTTVNAQMPTPNPNHDPKWKPTPAKQPAPAD